MTEHFWLYVLMLEKFVIAPLLIVFCVTGIVFAVRLFSIRKAVPSALSPAKLFAYQSWLIVAILTVAYFALSLLLIGFNS